MRPFIVVTSVALVAAAIITTLLFSGQRSSPQTAANLRTVLSPTEMLSPQQPPAASPTPTPWGIQDTTLVEVATGRTLRLQQDSEIVWHIEFSGDGRWLVVIYDNWIT